MVAGAFYYLVERGMFMNDKEYTEMESEFTRYIDEAVRADPAYYKNGDSISCRDAEIAMLDCNYVFISPIVSHLACDALEYIWRAPNKNGIEDYQKAINCLQEIVDNYREALDE